MDKLLLGGGIMVRLCSPFDICYLALAVAKNENQTSADDSGSDSYS